MKLCGRSGEQARIKRSCAWSLFRSIVAGALSAVERGAASVTLLTSTKTSIEGVLSGTVGGGANADGGVPPGSAAEVAQRASAAAEEARQRMFSGTVDDRNLFYSRALLVRMGRLT